MQNDIDRLPSETPWTNKRPECGISPADFYSGVAATLAILAAGGGNGGGAVPGNPGDVVVIVDGGQEG